ncbi:MAG TPA: AAA family ATPase [Candidatus Saccharimonadales bacterium]|nr:AAA family ATPase [Candidatus Saccharimonadales bacterium]
MQDDNPILHAQTATLLTSLARDLPQAIMLSGPRGVGKRYVTEKWLTRTGGFSKLRLRIIEPLEAKKGIAIEQIRDLYRASRAKQDEDQVFILDGADTMSLGAQNAFLKLLEEPNSSTHFVLLSHLPQQLLPTIRSRVQEVNIYPLETAQLEDFLRQTYPKLSKEAIQQILFVSRGRIGLASLLAQDKELLDEYRNQAAVAKEFLLGSKLDRLKIVGNLGNDRERALTILELVVQMARSLLHKAKTSPQTLNWASKIDLAEEVANRLVANGNIKAQLTYLALSL